MVSRKFIAAIIVVTIFSFALTVPSYATELVTVERDDLYTKLSEAAYINVLTNTLGKCMSGGDDGDAFYKSIIYGEDIAEGRIFNGKNTNISTALWLEKKIQKFSDDEIYKLSGSIYCDNGQSKSGKTDGTNILNMFAKTIGKTPTEILCASGNYKGFYRRYVFDDSSMSWTKTDVDCVSVNDSNGEWTPSDDNKEGFKNRVKSAYEMLFKNQKKAENPYLPEYSEIGSFNNIDGYFNYLEDFNTACKTDAEIYQDRPNNVTVYSITTFDRQDTKIIAKTTYVHLNSDNIWSYSLSADNSVTSCSELLERIESLRTTYNGVYEETRVDSTTPDAEKQTINNGDNKITMYTKFEDKRESGYEGIILAKLQDSCDKSIGEAKTKLNDIISSENATVEQKETAQKGLDQINNVTSGTYSSVVSSGSEAESTGKVYQCMEIEGVELALEEYQSSIDNINDETGDATCYSNAGSLGWIVCPIIEYASTAIQEIYSKIIEPFLALDTALFDSSSGTHEAWKQFRNIANIAFIILLIVVIFSQLTGIGIDNYGIKKSLPKIIIGAILVNLSYIICQLAVDVANIVGYSIGGLFNSIIDNSRLDVTKMTLAETGGSTADTAIVAGSAVVVALVGLLSVPSLLGMGIAVLIPVFMALISVLLAIIFCFVLLAVRKALAVILVVVSPLAFVCYMLPNTQPIFKKWFGAFKGVLLAFPICSAMIYGGQMVAKIIIMAAGVSNMPMTIALSAAVICIVPIFMIPKAVASSMTAISGITGSLAAARRGLTGRTRGGFDRSGLADRMRRAGANPYKYNKDGTVKRRKFRAWAQDRTTWTKSGKQRIAEGRAKYIRDETERRNTIDRWSGKNGAARAESAFAAAASRREAEEVSDFEAKIMRSGESDNIDVMQSKVADAMRSGDMTAVKAYTNQLMKKGDKGHQAVHDATFIAQNSPDKEGRTMSDETLQALGSHMSNNFGPEMKAYSRPDFEFYQKAASGARDDNGKLKAGNIGDYKTISKAGSYTAENWAGMDDRPVEDALESVYNGEATDEQLAYIRQAATEALNNENINLKGERRAALEDLVNYKTPKELQAEIDTWRKDVKDKYNNPATAPRPKETKEQWIKRMGIPPEPTQHQRKYKPQYKKPKLS